MNGSGKSLEQCSTLTPPPVSFPHGSAHGRGQLSPLPSRAGGCAVPSPRRRGGRVRKARVRPKLAAGAAPRGATADLMEGGRRALRPSRGGGQEETRGAATFKNPGAAAIARGNGAGGSIAAPPEHRVAPRAGRPRQRRRSRRRSIPARRGSTTRPRRRRDQEAAKHHGGGGAQ